MSTVIEALEAICRENLESMDFQVTHTADRTRKTWGGSTKEIEEETVVSVAYLGAPNEIHEVVDEHGDAEVERITTQPVFGEGMETRSELILTSPAHAAWTRRTPGGSLSGSSSSTSPAPSTEDGDSEPASQDDGGGITGEGPHQPFPDPSGRYVENPNGDIHVVANYPEDTEGGLFVCGAGPAKTNSAAIRSDYESLIQFCADPAVCEWCAKAMMGYYNIPEDKVLSTEKEEYG